MCMYVDLFNQSDCVTEPNNVFSFLWHISVNKQCLWTCVDVYYFNIHGIITLKSSFITEFIFCIIRSCWRGCVHANWTRSLVGQMILILESELSDFSSTTSLAKDPAWGFFSLWWTLSDQCSVSSVTLSGTSGSFAGFLLEARPVGGSSGIGSFSILNSDSQTLNCSGVSVSFL